MSIKHLKPRRQKKNRKGRTVGYKQGYFPVNESKKYEGPPVCIYRSSWEYKYMLYCERSAVVVNWSSEAFAIPYVDHKGVSRKYYPDFVVKYENGTKHLVEIKPYKETIAGPGKTYRMNYAKWKAAIAWCKEREGWQFVIVTEKNSILRSR